MSSVLNPSHAPVMHDEVIAGLEIKPKGRYVDGTYGRGGHARSILAELDQDGRLIVMDRDPQAIADARATFGSDARVTIIRQIRDVLPRQNGIARMTLEHEVESTVVS